MWKAWTGLGVINGLLDLLPDKMKPVFMRNDHVAQGWTIWILTGQGQNQLG